MEHVKGEANTAEDKLSRRYDLQLQRFFKETPDLSALVKKAPERD